MRLARLRYVDREQFVLDCCRSRTVLHVGCVGDRELREGEEPLHAKLARIAEELWGVDTNAEGLEAMRHGLPEEAAQHLVVGDAERLQETNDLPARFDVVLLGDLLEHVTNPGLVLTAARSRMEPDGRILVTTPNPFGLMGFLRLLRGREGTSGFHTCWFSFATLSRLAELCGLRVDRYLTGYDFLPRRGLARLKIQLGKHFFRLFPMYGGTLIAVLQRAEKER
jgi:2-polyprenyl-3-methyl-5-hydroxy-6-metoxy-1,4-benzoquinol methylase